jgi:5-methylcytosine-specific restriction endonuclease McrA
MSDFLIRIKPSTEGEKLFQHMGKLALTDLSKNRLSQQKFIRLTGRTDHFGNYLEGSMISFAFKRLIKATQGIYHDVNSDREVCNIRLNRLLIDWFWWLDRDSISSLMRCTLRAFDASNKSIANGISTDIWGAAHIHKCCFCGDLLTAVGNSTFNDSKGNKASLEHVWPSSLGGDSNKDNLVPACFECNNKKGDLLTWEDGHIHNFIYKVDFNHSDFINDLPRIQRIMLQRRAVFTLANREKITLKQALLRVGPYGKLKVQDSLDTWDIFNTQNHSESLGENLW